MKRIGRILLCILMITVLFGISIMGNFVVKSENKSKEKKRTAKISCHVSILIVIIISLHCPEKKMKLLDIRSESRH